MKDNIMDSLKIELIDIDKLTPYKGNAKIHTEEQIEQIKRSIEKFHMIDPLGVWGEQNIIVVGHGRLIACKELGYKELPCIRLDHLNDEERKAYTLAHNKLTMNTDFDFDKLEEELSNLTAFDFDMSDFGFDNADIDWAGIEDLSEKSYEEPEKKYIRCPHCGHIDTTTHFIKVNMTETEFDEGADEEDEDISISD